MRYLITAALLASLPVIAFGQANKKIIAKKKEKISVKRHNMFADVGIAELPIRHIPAASFTYNWKPSRHFGIGGGIQEYDVRLPMDYDYENSIVVPAIYGDVRLYLGSKNVFLMFLDFGTDYHAVKDYTYYPYAVKVEQSTMGVYTALGLGYSVAVNKKGDGVYCTLKIAGGTHTVHEHNIYTGRKDDMTGFNGGAILSVGYKF